MWCKLVILQLNTEVTLHYDFPPPNIHIHFCSYSVTEPPSPWAAQQTWSSVVQDERNQPCRMFLSCEPKEGAHLWLLRADNRHQCDIGLGNRSVRSSSGHKSVSHCQSIGFQHQCMRGNVSSSLIVQTEIIEDQVEWDLTQCIQEVHGCNPVE